MLDVEDTRKARFFVFCDGSFEFYGVEIGCLQVFDLRQDLTAFCEQREAAKGGEGGRTCKGEQHGH